MWKLQGSIRGVQEKLMWNFHRSWLLTFEFPRDVTQFCRISRRGSLKYLGQSDKFKNSRGVFPKSISSTSPVGIFSGIIQFHSLMYVFLCHKIISHYFIQGQNDMKRTWKIMQITNVNKRFTAFPIMIKHEKHIIYKRGQL